MSKALPMAAASCCVATPLPRLKTAADLVRVYKALADDTRLRILSLLKDGEVCVCHIHGGLRLPQPTISRHLAYLRRAGLVAARRSTAMRSTRLGRPAVVKPHTFSDTPR